MNWVEHMQTAAENFYKESKKHIVNGNFDLAKAATKDAKAIEQLIVDIENGKTQEKK